MSKKNEKKTHKVFYQEKNTEAENSLLYSCLGRVKKGDK